MNASSLRIYADASDINQRPKVINFDLALKATYSRINRTEISFDIAKNTAESVDYINESIKSKINEITASKLVESQTNLYESLFEQNKTIKELVKSLENKIDHVNNEIHELKIAESELFKKIQFCKENQLKLRNNKSTINSKLFDLSLRLEISSKQVKSNVEILDQSQSEIEKIKLTREQTLCELTSVTELVTSNTNQINYFYNLLTAKSIFINFPCRDANNNRKTIDYSELNTVKNEYSSISDSNISISHDYSILDEELRVQHNVVDSVLYLIDEEENRNGKLQNYNDGLNNSVQSLNNQINITNIEQAAAEKDLERILAQIDELKTPNLKSHTDIITNLDNQAEKLQKEIDELNLKKKFKKKRIFKNSF